ncbi:3-oxoadipate enol-lactonase [Brevundimonas diminuta]|jgi:3-oxoadipate enol-lactonase|uniref:3-oxoadipate enol-lactonase n=1 Tax=Brevundimonas diminuta TaxID=293 RepID=A0A1Z3LYD4_BREDI|nr:3-oxoadipate enol-lactonase [Brevundimonas diminuta]ASD27202.1 3-oxoadipate enol-lactonase [Brevundimonas diminuta]
MSGQVQHITTGDGCRLAYRLDGPEDAPVLLLSNSLGTRMEMWDAQMAAFAARFRVLRYDSRGHGASDAPAGAYGLDRLGRDVVELLDALTLERVAFCGLSLGGMVGQWMGVRAPERLERLVLANTSAFMGPPSAWDARIASALSQGMAPLAAASVARWFTPDFAARAPDPVAVIEAGLLATSPQGYAGCCAAIRDMDLRQLGGLITTPTLVISGAADPATPPEHAAALVKAIPEAQLKVLDGAHLSNVEQPDLFADAVLSFLAA